MVTQLELRTLFIPTTTTTEATATTTTTEYLQEQGWHHHRHLDRHQGYNLNRLHVVQEVVTVNRLTEEEGDKKLEGSERDLTSFYYL